MLLPRSWPLGPCLRACVAGRGVPWGPPLLAVGLPVSLGGGSLWGPPLARRWLGLAASCSCVAAVRLRSRLGGCCGPFRALRPGRGRLLGSALLVPVSGSLLSRSLASGTQTHRKTRANAGEHMQFAVQVGGCGEFAQSFLRTQVPKRWAVVPRREASSILV